MAVVRRLAWVTAGAARGRDPDEPLALDALRSAGLDVDVVDWDDEDVEWASYDRAVLRSTWDYAERLGDFLVWLESVDAVTDLRNPLPMVRWSLDKHYLADLADAGIPVPPTAFVEPDGAAALPADAVVVKPSVGAGSRDAASYGAADADRALAHIDRLHARGVAALVQPLLASVAIEGEWPLVFFEGRYSHAARKRVELPRAGAVEDLFAEESSEPHVPDHGQLAVAQAAVDLVTARFGPPTYARVDIVRDADDSPCVLEVELVEPSLFLPEAEPDALGRLVRAFTSP